MKIINKMEKQLTNIEQAKLVEKERLKALHEEPFCVLIQLEGFPLSLRITYSKQKSDRIIQIEELGLEEQPETLCIFKGKSSIGTGCSYLKDVKQALQGLKPSDWPNNQGWIESYYKKH